MSRYRDRETVSPNTLRYTPGMINPPETPAEKIAGGKQLCLLDMALAAGE
jgi:hypothetical protein